MTATPAVPAGQPGLSLALIDPETPDSTWAREITTTITKVWPITLKRADRLRDRLIGQ